MAELRAVAAPAEGQPILTEPTAADGPPVLRVDIRILPDGRVIFGDLPPELADVARLLAGDPVGGCRQPPPDPATLAELLQAGPPAGASEIGAQAPAAGSASVAERPTDPAENPSPDDDVDTQGPAGARAPKVPQR